MDKKIVEKVTEKNEIKLEPKAENLTCGLVMPISAVPGCPAEHWSDIKGIITESIEGIREPKFTVKLVSEADDVGVIQKRIVQNIYNSDVVICDVSGKNPNVMFELGMRLAFDKPTIIMKDDATDYSFDTAIIEHIPYPRDLRFTKMMTFKSLLCEKVIGTYNAFKSNPDASTFLKNFGKFHVASLSQDVVSSDKLVVEMLMEMQGDLSRLRRQLPRTDERNSRARPAVIHGELDPIAGMTSLFRALDTYSGENPAADLNVIVNDDEFQRDIIRRCNASLYFPRRSQFEIALRRAVEDITAMSAASVTKVEVDK